MSPSWLATDGYPESKTFANRASEPPIANADEAPAPNRSILPHMPNRMARRETCPRSMALCSIELPESSDSQARRLGKAGGYVQRPEFGLGNSNEPVA